MHENVVVLLQVIMIDVTLAGDNAIVIGLAAAGLPHEQRNKAIFVGIVAATILRIIFAGLSVQLLKIVGLLFAGAGRCGVRYAYTIATTRMRPIFWRIRVPALNGQWRPQRPPNPLPGPLARS